MIKVENIVTPSSAQWDSVIRACRNPYDSWGKSDSSYNVSEKSFLNSGEIIYLKLGENDLGLLRRLAKAGSDHRKYLRQLSVIMDIVAPTFFDAELDTYKVATVRNSCSFMHRGCAKPFTIEDFSVYGESDRESIKATIVRLNVLREKYLETKDDNIFLQIRSILPSGYNYRFTWSANYEVLWNIYQARKNHRLPEWREFCQIIVREIPYFAEILGIEAEK